MMKSWLNIFVLLLLLITLCQLDECEGGKRKKPKKKKGGGSGSKNVTKKDNINENKVEPSEYADFSGSPQNTDDAEQKMKGKRKSVIFVEEFEQHPEKQDQSQFITNPIQLERVKIEENPGVGNEKGDRIEYCSQKSEVNIDSSSIGKKWFDKNKNYEILDEQFLWLDNQNIIKRKKLILQFKKGESGYRFFRIAVEYYNSVGKSNNKYSKFTNILVPDDAYKFVSKLDEIILVFATENFEHKLHNQGFLPTAVKISYSAGHQQHKFEVKILQTARFSGVNHEFQLELLQNNNKGIFLRLESINKNPEITKEETYLNLPLCALPWLREQMAEMLIKHDGTVKIEKEAPVQIPRLYRSRQGQQNEGSTSEGAKGITLKRDHWGWIDKAAGRSDVSSWLKKS